MSLAVEIDGLEAVLTAFRSQGELQNLVGGRIDTKHRYGQETNDWSLTDKSIVISPVATADNIYLDIQPIRAVVRCYAGLGNGDEESKQIYLRVLQFLNDFGDSRNTVETQNGKALIYFIVPETVPFFGIDDELNISSSMNYVEFTISSQVANKIVT